MLWRFDLDDDNDFLYTVMYLFPMQQFLNMSKKAKKNAPLPDFKCRLLRFFEDETKGVKVKPEIILGISWCVNWNLHSIKDFDTSLIFLTVNE